MSLLSEFTPVTRTRPCPICGRQKYCLVERTSISDPARVVCTKVESPKKWNEAGWLHTLRDEQWHRPRPVRVRNVPNCQASSALDLGGLAGFIQAAADPGALFVFASELGLGVEGLQRLCVGWMHRAVLMDLGTSCSGKGCWAFPMVAADRRVVGIRLRTPEGFKYALSGSKQGLFVPPGLSRRGLLLVAEGPTDTAALLDLGFAAVGRPSCTGGTRMLSELARSLQPARVAILSDNDAPGRHGAAALAAVLAAYVQDVRVIRPPDGIEDARAWKNCGLGLDAVAAQIDEAIEAAAPTRLKVITRRRGR
jgi:hypothetical protein